MDELWAVVMVERDEDGLFRRTYLFNSREEAIDFANDCYGNVYKMVPEVWCYY